MEEGLGLVERAIEGALASDVALLSSACAHVIRSGGKRLRPTMVLLSYRAAGGEDVSQVVEPAAALELLHTASLVHDDINDRSDMRRGKASVNALWGDGLALLVGDFVFVGLVGLLSSFDSRAIRVVADSCKAIVEGETLHVMGLGNHHMTEETYLSIVSKKTGALFAASAEVGGHLAGGSEDQVRGLREYGLNVGIAFQIRDDALDVVGSERVLGKPVAGDLEQGKISLATLYTLQSSQRARECVSGTDATALVECVREAGGLEYAMKTAREYSERAKEALQVLAPSQAKAALSDLADYAVTRDR